MSKTLIVGNSLVVVEAIKTIRQSDLESEISLFCTESLLPYDRYLLPSLVAGEMKENQICSLKEGFFTNNHVEVIANEKIARVSLKRQYVTTQSKKQIEFDQLLVADLGVLKDSPVKGHQKKGVFDCSLLSSVKDMIKFLPFVDSAFVNVTNLQGFNMACALHKLGKEVVIVTSDTTLLSNIFDEETGSLLKQIIEGKGVRVLLSSSIDEILGDSEIKAIKLASGKVFATQMVIFDSLELDQRLLETDEGYQKIEDQFFDSKLPASGLHFGFNLLNGFCLGVTKIPPDGREYLKFDGPVNIFKKIFAKGDEMVGAVLFNSPTDIQGLSQIIINKTSISGKEEALIGGL